MGERLGASDGQAAARGVSRRSPRRAGRDGALPREEAAAVLLWKKRQFFGEHCDDQMVLKRFHKDLALLGARPRRQHDARRTFISLTVGS